MNTLSVVNSNSFADVPVTADYETKDTQVLSGNIEEVNLGIVTGWVVNSYADDKGIAVELYENNTVVAAGIADTRREDLASAGYTEGAFGFELRLDTSLLDGREHDLHLRLAGTTDIVAVNTISISPAASSRIDSIEAGIVNGYVTAVEHPDTDGFNIELLVDGRPVESGICTKDVTGLYRFAIPLPVELFDDNPYIFTICVKGMITTQAPYYDRLPSVQTPWQYLTDSGVGTRLSAMSKTSSYRYASLQLQLTDLYKDSANTDMASRLARITLAHDVLVEGHEGRKNYVELELDRVPEPKVSIVIPVHNKFELTYHCIASLILARNEVDFEVIIVDDMSSDETVRARQHISNLRVVNNSQNKGFLLSSKHGAEQAIGEYIVFLNNDTEVTSGWLDALVEAFDTYDSVGLAGSKLIYPNGKLQEAGGIVWGSGRPWNIGNGQNAEHPMYNYTRQADYLSGASLMVRRSVWEEIGGFSEEFVPAYYEDTDLAFKVREAGYKTMYCPFSTVVHFEGMSNGRDTNTGIKRFQSINSPKFRSKWRHAYRHNGAEGKDLLKNMDRGVDFRAVVVDYATPRPDQDAGGYAAIQEIKLLQELGCKVTFVPNNMAHMGRHTDVLQKQGVECIFAPFYNSVGEFLKDRGRDYDLVYVTRYDIAEQVIASIRQFTSAKIIFNNADLHFLRELRAAFASGDRSFEEPVKTRDREFKVMRDVDAILSYNEVEHSVIASHNLTQENVFKCPWVLQDRRSNVPFEERHGIAFLGGFNHQPNREAVKYFVDSVMPLLRVAQPDIKFHVYGSKVTPDIEALACSDVIIEGYVESLSDMFNTCRVFIAPLLSGAGIKGKVLESIAHGIPSVLSPVAAEATGLCHRHSALIAHEPSDWSESIAELYTDAELWQSISDRSHDLIETDYSRAEGLNRMEDVLRYIELDPAETRTPLFSNELDAAEARTSLSGIKLDTTDTRAPLFSSAED